MDNVPVSPSISSYTKRLLVHRSGESSDTKKTVIEIRRKLPMDIGFNFVPTEPYDLEQISLA